MATQPRIVHLIGALVAGGAERFLVDLLVEMKHAGMPVELLCLSTKRDAVGDRWTQRLEGAGVPITRGPATRLRPSTVAWLSKQLRAKDIGLVHVHLHYVEQAYYLSRFFHRRRYPVIRTIHNTSMPMPGLQSIAFRRSDIRTSITCGAASQEAYRGLTRGESFCIPYGLKFDWPRHDPSQRDERLAPLGLDSEQTHFIAAGSMSAATLEKGQKAQDDLIRAWRAGDVGAKGGVLHLLGTGTLKPQLEAMAEGDDSIIFHGVVANMSEWMGATDVYLMPSRWEGLPLAGIEATATGIPCVFSEIDPLRELQNSVATFFPMGDIDALAARLNEHLGCRRSATDEALEEARDRFGIERSAVEYRTVYDSLD